jgi:hypothetical protein
MRPEARSHPDRAGVDAAGRWGESHASYPGRSAGLPQGLVTPRGVATGEQKSAEAVLSRSAQRRRAEHEEPNRHGALDA